MAATHPDRVSSLVIVNGTASDTRGHDYPRASRSGLLDRFLDLNFEPDAVDKASTRSASSRRAFRTDDTFRAWWNRAGNHGAGTGHRPADGPGSVPVRRPGASAAPASADARRCTGATMPRSRLRHGALPRGAHPERGVCRAPRRRRPLLGRRHRPDARRDRGVPHRRPPRADIDRVLRRSCSSTSPARTTASPAPTVGDAATPRAARRGRVRELERFRGREPTPAQPCWPPSTARRGRRASRKRSETRSRARMRAGRCAHRRGRRTRRKPAA